MRFFLVQMSLRVGAPTDWLAGHLEAHYQELLCPCAHRRMLWAGTLCGTLTEEE